MPWKFRWGKNFWRRASQVPDQIMLSVYAIARLVEESLITLQDAETSLNTIAAHRNWIGRAIFERAKALIGIS